MSGKGREEYDVRDAALGCGRRERPRDTRLNSTQVWCGEVRRDEEISTSCAAESFCELVRVLEVDDDCLCATLGPRRSLGRLADQYANALVAREESPSDDRARIS